MFVVCDEHVNSLDRRGRQMDCIRLSHIELRPENAVSVGSFHRKWKQIDRPAPEPRLNCGNRVMIAGLSRACQNFSYCEDARHELVHAIFYLLLNSLHLRRKLRISLQKVNEEHGIPVDYAHSPGPLMPCFLCSAVGSSQVSGPQSLSANRYASPPPSLRNTSEQTPWSPMIPCP